MMCDREFISMSGYPLGIVCEVCGHIPPMHKGGSDSKVWKDLKHDPEKCFLCKNEKRMIALELRVGLI